MFQVFLPDNSNIRIGILKAKVNWKRKVRFNDCIGAAKIGGLA